MVTSLTLTGILLQGIIPVVGIIGIFLYFYRKERFSWKPVAAGALTFFFFTQILEKILHLAVLGTNPDFSKQTLLLIIYGPLAAGVFEETGRYLIMLLLLKRYRQRKDGIAFGIGHGGFEALFIGLLGCVQSLTYALLLNQGKLDALLAGKLPVETIASLKDTLLNVPFSHLLMGGLERLPAIVIQIALSLFILYGIRTGKKSVWPTAILLHATFDFLPAMYQAHYVNLWIAEGFVFLFGCLAAAYITKSRQIFSS
ncbi:YhfC family intramembrane metalloprotease [Paenibacillus sp. N3.4]|uniref:YhfC family intramembrane metalloprotease n=1 Tax=Paenibacillus sp. N3.4 TaxID=2603222 RepID=UPI0011CBC55E|nr:YhfC family glutamic-type intramembrane protease [Paenibacillus sp. N3.4]TXK76896.1 YhfC family intramembrane metalloprotease [Paenibacillus sp. N3.4]